MRVVDSRPIVTRPVKVEGVLALHAENLPNAHEAHVTVRLPDFELFSLAALAKVAFGNLRNCVVDLAVGRGAEKFDVLSMGPHQWHGGTSGPAAPHKDLGPVVLVPGLLREQAGCRSKILHRTDIGLSAAPGGKLVMAPFTSEQRPNAAHTMLRKRTTVLLLAISIVVIAMPGWPRRRIRLEHSIDHFEGGDDGGVVRPADTVADQFQKAAIDDVARWEITLLTGGMVGDVQDAGFFALRRLLLADLLGQNSHVIRGRAFNKRACRGCSPVFNVRFKIVGIFFDENCGRLLAALTEEKRRADESGNIRGERGGRVAGGLFPALLLSDRTIADQVSGTLADQVEGIEVSQALFTAKTPRQHDRESDLVKLNAAPVGISVDPEVLREPAVVILRDGQVDQRPERSRRVAASKQSRCTVDHVAGPHKMIAALIAVAFGLSPRNGERRDEGAGQRTCLHAQAEGCSCCDRDCRCRWKRF